MYRLLRLLFGWNAVNESVTTQVHVNASPEVVWNRMKFYEEVPGPPPWLLRLFLPMPVRTEGNKELLGSMVRCKYSRGDLFKRIVAVDEPHLLGFEVVHQQLGIESCIVARSGSYQISGHGDGVSVTLTTNYQAQLGPRRLWRPVEKLLIHHLHRHILGGLAAAESYVADNSLPAVPRPILTITPPRGTACTPSLFPFRR